MTFEENISIDLQVQRWLVVKRLPMQKTGDAGSISGSGRSPGGGNAPHSSTLAWRIPWTEEPGGL